MNSTTRPLVLVIDDEASILRLFQKRLESWNYTVVTAQSGERGLEILAETKPDVVLTDLFMPHPDGFAVLEHIQRAAPDLPVIVLSGQGALRDAIEALRLGAWDYIYKPVEEMAFLRMAIEKVLEKARLIEENRNYRNHLERMLARKSAELVASEKRYRTVADFTYHWEYWADPAGRIVYISPSCERITGYCAAEFEAAPALMREIIHPDDRTTFTAHCRNEDDPEDVCQIDFRIVRRDGETRWIAHTCRPVRDTEGNYLGRRGSNRDITYRKKIENDLMDKHRELMDKTVSLEKANEALKSLLDQREVEKRSIEQTMVNNLKRFVFPYLDNLTQSKIDKEAVAYVDIIRTNIEQLVSPVSKSLSGAYLDFTPTEVRVADLIRRGESSKSIAAILNASPSTVAIHRNNIRKKLGILNRRVNLRTYLNSLA